MMNLKAAFAAICIVLLSSCAAIQSVSLTPIPAKKGKKVEAVVSKTIVLSMNFNNDFVDEIVENLKRQCPGGVVSGILTKDETFNYFLYLVYTRKVTATGFCQQNSGLASANSVN